MASGIKARMVIGSTVDAVREAVHQPSGEGIQGIHNLADVIDVAYACLWFLVIQIVMYLSV